MQHWNERCERCVNGGACARARVTLTMCACVILCRAPECDHEHLHRTVDL